MLCNILSNNQHCNAYIIVKIATALSTKLNAAISVVENHTTEKSELTLYKENEKQNCHSCTV